jgi:hypothetical protein
MNNNSANGLDEVSAKLVKFCGQNLVPVLIRVFNHHIRIGLFPEELKTARTVPVYKSGIKKMTANYRPICIRSNLAKILEKIMYRRLNSFYEAVGFINEYQFRFVKRSSTITTAMNFITAISEGF